MARQAKPALLLFRARSIPRFSSEEFDVRYYDSLIAQRALIDMIMREILGRGARVELRLSSDGDRGRISVEIALHDEHGLLDRAVIDQLEALLPPIYDWEAVYEPRTGARSDGHFVRVARRLEFVNLPIVSTAVRDAMLSRDESRAIDDTNVPDGPLSGFADLTDDGPRQLPSAYTDPAELDTTQFCLPLPGPIEQHRPRQRVLFEELVRARPATVSLCLHPIDQADLDFARAMSLSFKQFLNAFAIDIARSGFSDLDTVRTAFDRFTLPSTHLAHLTVRASAPGATQSAALGNVMASMLGGGRAFSVSTPDRLDDPQKLCRPPPYVASVRADGGIEKARDAWLDGELERAGVSMAVEDRVVRLMVLLPHIYAADEVTGILQLPAADEEGLPGVDARLAPPFAPPPSSWGPVVDSGHFSPPPLERVRLGMSRDGARGGGGGGAGATSRPGLAPGRFHDRSWQAIDIRELTKHALITGSTGSGKTLTTLFLVREMARLQVPFLIIEPTKTEYFDRLSRNPQFVAEARGFQRRRFTGGSTGREAKDFLIFDPMRLQPGVSVWRHCSYLASCFEAAMPLEPLAALILRDGLISYYTDPYPGCGLQPFDLGGDHLPLIRPVRAGGPDAVWPSLNTFFTYFKSSYLPRAFPVIAGQPRLAEMRETFVQIFRRRFDAIARGLVGRAATLADTLAKCGQTDGRDPFSALLERDTVIELDGIPDDDEKALVMAFLLTALFERRQSDDAAARANNQIPEDKLRHLLIVEEAHRVLAKPASGRSGDLAGSDARTKTVQLFVNMLAEIRALGQGIVIVEQIPTKIAPDAIKNSNLKIMLRLTAPDDRDYLGEAMNFTEAQKRFVTSLRVDKGQQFNFVVFEQGIDQPVLLSLPLPVGVDDSWLYDEFFPAGEEQP